jgi:glycosyltransferase involved in cell wall biosynthesis
MKILFIGTRGIPGNYGGFETCVEELAARLAKEHEVVVYCRSQYHQYKIKYYQGARLVYLPTVRVKFIDTLFHTTLSIIHAIIFNWNSYFLIFNSANSICLFLPFLLRRKMAINTDGLEWKRDKWGNIGKIYYQFAEWLATKLVSNVITDSKGMHDYYVTRWNKKSTTIEYGAYTQKSINPRLITNYNIEPNKYFLQITRIEPENNPQLTLDSFIIFKKKNPGNEIKLVIVGDVPYKSQYSQLFKQTANCDDVVALGFEYDSDILTELRTNCLAYIHGNQVGGTNPALLEAMGAGAYVLARDVLFNREVLSSGGKYYDRDEYDLAEKMNWVVQNECDLARSIEYSVSRIRNYYNWDRIANEYSNLISVK